MRAAVLKSFGNSDQLKIETVEEPEIRPGEILIEVHAFSINPVETLIRAGKAFTESWQKLDPAILGWDVSGKVVKTGSQVHNFREGDEVFGMVKFPEPASGYAELVAAPEEHLALKPGNITHKEAAASTLAALTAWQALVHQAKLQKNQKVLILNASGGVGHFAVQMAKHLGAYVIGTSSGAKRDFVLGLGADEHIDYQKGAFTDQVKDADVVLDGIGGDTSYDALKVLKKGGTVITLLAIATDLPEKAQESGMNGQIMMVSPSGRDMESIARLLESGQVKPYIERSYSFEDTSKAHEHLETGRTKGKVVVKVQ